MDLQIVSDAKYHYQVQYGKNGIGASGIISGAKLSELCSQTQFRKGTIESRGGVSCVSSPTKYTRIFFSRVP